MGHVVGRRWRLLATAFCLLTTSCGAFGLRQDVETARTNRTINQGGRQAVMVAEALQAAFEAQAYAADHAAEFTQRAGEALAALEVAERSSGPSFRP